MAERPGESKNDASDTNNTIGAYSQPENPPASEAHAL
jgi:hypothetical protein